MPAVEIKSLSVRQNRGTWRAQTTEPTVLISMPDHIYEIFTHYAYYIIYISPIYPYDPLKTTQSELTVSICIWIQDDLFGDRNRTTSESTGMNKKLP